MKIVFHPVLNHGDYSIQAHQGAECAGEQNQFWAFREFLFKNQHRIWKHNAVEVVKKLGTEYGLNVDAFNTCMDEQRYATRVDKQDDLRRTRGIRLQPTFDINGQQVIGMAMFQTLDGIIQQSLGGN